MWPGKTRAIDYNPTAAFPFLSSHSFTLLALLSRVIYSKSLSPSLSLSRFYSPSPLPPKYRFVLHYSHLSILPYLSPFFRFLYTKRLQKKNVEWAFCCYFSSQMPDLHIPWLKCACLCFSTPHYIMCHNTQKKNKSLSWGVFFFFCIAEWQSPAISHWSVQFDGACTVIEFSLSLIIKEALYFKASGFSWKTMNSNLPGSVVLPGQEHVSGYLVWFSSRSDWMVSGWQFIKDAFT